MVSEAEAGQGVQSGSSQAVFETSASLEPATTARPEIAPDHEAPKDDTKVDPPSLEAPKDDVKVDPPKVEARSPEMPKAEPFEVKAQNVETAEAAAPGKPEAPQAGHHLLIMSPGEQAWQSQERKAENRNWEEPERNWDSRTAGPKPEDEAPAKGAGKRRFAAMAAMLAIAVIAGAAGGALATAGLSHFTKTAAATAANAGLQASVARMDADIVALKAGLAQTSKASLNQINRTNDRIERIEKAQAEPAAKLARLSEAVDKLHAAPAVQAPVVVAAATPKEATGSVTAPAGAQALPVPQASPAAEAKVEGRLPIVEGWVLRDAGHGSALIESRRGLYQVFAGDPVPGLGRIDAIRRQDGRWVVVTSKGLIVAR